MTNEEYVKFRLANGSFCGQCPLNNRRKVGCDGDFNSPVVLIGEAPGESEEEYLQDRAPYGKPFQGRSGWALKAKLLAPAGLVETEIREDGWIKIKKMKAFVFNRILCRPPNNKINSPEAKKAIACCSNSARALLQKLQESSSTRCYVPLGGTALDLLTERDKIGLYRGRVMPFDDQALVPMPEGERLKIALRGVKPPPEILPTLKVIQSVILKQRAAMKPEAIAKKELARKKLLLKEMLALVKPHIAMIAIFLRLARKGLNLSSSS